MENNSNSIVSTESKVYTAEEVAAILGVPRSTSYREIKRPNIAELEVQGYITVTGKISKRYFHGKSYL